MIADDGVTTHRYHTISFHFSFFLIQWTTAIHFHLTPYAQRDANSFDENNTEIRTIHINGNTHIDA